MNKPDILILISFIFSFFLAMGYLITFFTAYVNGLFYNSYQTIFNINSFNEATIEAVAFGLILIFIVIGFNTYLRQFSVKYQTQPKSNRTVGQTTIWFTIIGVATVGFILLILAFLNR